MQSKNKHLCKYFFKILFSSIPLLFSVEINSAELQITDVPLYLGNSNVPPNVLFVIDDSGSMDWEIMSKDLNRGGRFTGSQPDGTNPGSAGSVKHRDSDDDDVANCVFWTNSYTNPSIRGTFYGYIYGVEFGSNSYNGDGPYDCDTADDEAWRFRNHDFNPLYFNPNKTYVPWSGLDDAGNPFTNIPITNALADPYDTSSETIDLTRHNSNWKGGTTRTTSDRDNDGEPDGFRYYIWNDDGDGVYENTEQEEHPIKDESPAVQQNFANWFSYYRSREFVAKAAFGRVIAQTDNMRMGVATLYDNNSYNSNIPLRLMNSDVATGNKKAILDNLYSIKSAGGTPLQTTFKGVGEYLSDKNNVLFADNESAPLSATQGGACQQNFALLMTDGFYNGSYSDSNPKISNADGDGNTNFDGGAFADSKTKTLADIAMHYYEKDIIPVAADMVPTIPGIDEANHQHMVTFSIAFGVDGSLTAMPPDPNTPFSWPDPFASNAGKIDDLRHAAYNGRGNFLQADNPDALVSALNTTLNNIIARTSAAAAVTFNTGSIQDGSMLYQGRFNSGDWSGELNYIPVSSSGSLGAVSIEAGAVLDAKNPTDRVILSYRPDTNLGIPFRSPTDFTTPSASDFSNAQLTALMINAPNTSTAADQTYLENIIEFLRGDDSNELTQGGGFRDRTGKLGDIINSAPTFVGASAFSYEFDNYATFITAQKNRTPLVYIGANDGMLHGFNATTGEELLAYVPSTAVDNLYRLSELLYPTNHKYFVDGTPVVGDVYYGSNWRTVLVGGMASGGQAYYALDVTDPSSFAESAANNIALWEFTDADDPDLGIAVSEPVITKMNNGKWVAIFGNGYNNTVADGNASTTGNAVLFIVDIQNGSVIKKIDTGVGKTQDPEGNSHPNGLATPAVIDADGDFLADYIYVADLFGNLWRMDVADSDPTKWVVGHQGNPLFKTLSVAGNPQPITTRPMVGLHPDPYTYDGYMVYFGTGKYFEKSDNSDTGQETQSIYGIWDNYRTDCLTSKPCAATNPAFTAPTRSDLVQQNILAESTLSGSTYRVTSDYDIDWALKKGWLLDLVDPDDGLNHGERVITNMLLREGRLILTTMIPSVALCAFGGSGWIMELAAENGGRLPSSPYDINGDGVFDQLDVISIASLGITDAIVSGVLIDSGIPSAPTVVHVGGTSGSAGNDYYVDGSDVAIAGTGYGTGGTGVTQPRDLIVTNDTSGGLNSQNSNTQSREGRVYWRQLR